MLQFSDLTDEAAAANQSVATSQTSRNVLYYLVIAVFGAAAAFTSCGGGSGSSGGGNSGGGSVDNSNVKMTTESSNLFFRLYGSGVATVDWGDGSEKDSLTLKENEGANLLHEYPNEAGRTITINGENITKLYCRGNNLTGLDVNNATALTVLECGGNQLKKLFVSQCAALKVLICDHNQLIYLQTDSNALTELRCGNNQLSSSALNNLFSSLHGNAGEKIISISYKDAHICDRDIAEDKGWKFIFE